MRQQPPDRSGRQKEINPEDEETVDDDRFSDSLVSASTRPAPPNGELPESHRQTSKKKKWLIMLMAVSVFGMIAGILLFTGNLFSPLPASTNAPTVPETPAVTEMLTVIETTEPIKEPVPEATDELIPDRTDEPADTSAEKTSQQIREELNCTVVTTVRNVYLRKTPEDSGEKLAMLGKDEPVHMLFSVTGSDGESWTWVETGGQQGYIKTKYLAVNEH